MSGDECNPLGVYIVLSIVFAVTGVLIGNISSFDSIL